MKYPIYLDENIFDREINFIINFNKNYLTSVFEFFGKQHGAP